tara:strand:+ start:1120 stop:2286 length:1167 start_codon:yes stop_codon:yes gene_type:complete
MGLLTENNAQYYSGQQTFFFEGTAAITDPTFKCTFNSIVVSAFNSLGVMTDSASNYTVYLQGSNAKAEDLSYISSPNVITLRGTYTPADLGAVIIQLKQPTILENYGSYEYISLNEIINNFIVAYTGEDKLINKIKRTDVIFHAKRGLQEFSYDTLKSIKSQELTIPSSLGVPIPQDYVNYVRCSWTDNAGVLHIIYPVNNLTTSPYDLPIQDAFGVPIQNAFSDNLQAEQSLIEEKWNRENQDNLSGVLDRDNTSVFTEDWWKIVYGQRYGLEPQLSQQNGWFQINEREGKFTFSSDLVGKVIALEYISDGLAHDTDSRVPKMAEDALYAHINHSILSTKPNVPEYIVQRYQRERSAKLRNAKIRLSNIKLGEIVQVMRGKSKWLKH